jgi:hypothetical protein
METIDSSVHSIVEATSLRVVRGNCGQRSYQQFSKSFQGIACRVCVVGAVGALAAA